MPGRQLGLVASNPKHGNIIKSPYLNGTVVLPEVTVLSKSDAVDTAKRIPPEYRTELDCLDKIDRYIRGDHAGPHMPKSASTECKLLAERAVMNLMLVVNGLGQALYVEGYRSSVDGKTAGAWR